MRGLLPPRVHSQTEQMLQVVANVRKKSSDLERYVFMMGLQDRSETVFYRTPLDHLEEMMPIIYTPTVGLACQEYGHIFRRPRGIFVSMRDAGRVRKILQNWPAKDVQVIVVTDGERTLGLVILVLMVWVFRLGSSPRIRHAPAFIPRLACP